jgi:CheY-like chemotaxis protein
MSKIVWSIFAYSVYIYAGDSYTKLLNDDYSLALFALAVVSVFMLFIFSKQISSIKKMYQKMFQRQQRIEEKQATVLAQMGEKIQCMTQDVITQCDSDTQSYIPNKADSKEELLDITNDMIEFLKIKSKKVEITHEKFNLNNVLNEVSGRLGYEYLGSKVEIIFDIENDIPRYLIGDSLHFGNVLYNILQYCMEYLVEKELKLHITQKSKGKANLELRLEITNTGRLVQKDELDMFFVPQYDEAKEEYSGLGMFIAYELVKLMNGKIDATQKKNTGVVFDIRLPFEIYNPSDMRKYRLPDKVMTNKRVLIVDTNEDSAKALQKMFGYFRNNIDVLSSEKFNSKKPDFSKYDIVVLDELQFSYRVVSYLHSLKSKQDIKVVSLNSLLNINRTRYDDPVVDAVLLKPVNQERIFELILSLYDLLDTQYNTRSKIKTHTENIRPIPNITQDSFSDFRGYRVLIVEDNIVNSRVLVNLLRPVGVETTVANNGKEAVDILQKEPKDRFDLIIMDINMPVMDGFSATQTIRYDPKFDNIPILALTALVLDSEKKKMFNSGMNAYLSKPLDISKLYAAMRLFLKPKTTQAAKVKKVSQPKDDNILNIQRGIINTNNNRLLYIELLNEFIEAYGHSDVVFAKLVQEHRYEQLKMMAIDVRGITATIGAYSMNREVEAISKDIIFKRYDNLDKAVETYRDELRLLVKSINSYLGKDKS